MEGRINFVRKTALTVSGALKEFMDETGASINEIGANLVQEKMYADRKEYVLDFYKRPPAASKQNGLSESEIEDARAVLEKMLKLMRFTSFTVERTDENGLAVLRISAGEKDGLLIGKNGQNLTAMQYLISAYLDKKLKHHAPLIIDVDSYREKRLLFLKSTAKAMSDKASACGEVISDFLPSYERKVIHEALLESGVITFSIGRGSYKKVVVTALL